MNVGINVSSKGAKSLVLNPLRKIQQQWQKEKEKKHEGKIEQY